MMVEERGSLVACRLLFLLCFGGFGDGDLTYVCATTGAAIQYE